MLPLKWSGAAEHCSRALDCAYAPDFSASLSHPKEEVSIPLWRPNFCPEHLLVVQLRVALRSQYVSPSAPGEMRHRG